MPTGFGLGGRDVISKTHTQPFPRSFLSFQLFFAGRGSQRAQEFIRTHLVPGHEGGRPGRREGVAVEAEAHRAAAVHHEVEPAVAPIYKVFFGKVSV